MHKVINKRLFVRGNTHVITHNTAIVCPPMQLDQCYSCRNRSSDEGIFQSVSVVLPFEYPSTYINTSYNDDYCDEGLCYSPLGL